MVPLDPDRKLEHWYWASFHELRDRVSNALQGLDSVDAEVTRALGTLTGPVLPSTGSPDGYVSGDRRQLAAFGARCFTAGGSPGGAALRAFIADVERLLAQPPADPDSWDKIPRLAFGIAMGVRKLDVDGYLCRDVAARLLSSASASGISLRNRICLTTAASIVSGDQTALETLARALLAYEPRKLSDSDAVAVLWFESYVGRLGTDNVELSKLRSIRERIPQIRETAFDALDWAMLTTVLDQIAASLQIAVPADPVQHVEAAIEAFADAVLQLSSRRPGKESFKVDDEYDVQDLLYTMLRPALPDIDKEDYAPKDAGSNKRVDLVSRSASLIVECKFVRDRAHAKAVFDEVKIDVQSYHTHPACRDLFFFLYDPKGLIASAKQREAEMSGPREVRPGRRVTVFLRIRK